MQALIFRII